MVKINQLSSPLFGGSGSGGGKIKQIILLSITTAPSGTFAKGSQYYNSSTKKIYTAVVADSWNDAKVEDPQFGVIYLFDNQGTTEYYQWDGDNLVETDLEKYQLIANKSDDYTEDSSIKYPSSKALSDGLKSVEPKLYDIKILSQAIAEKGWVFLCKSTRQDLAKADVPTIYADILNKYNNADSGFTFNSSTPTTDNGVWYCETKKKYYYSNGGHIYESANADLSSPTDLGEFNVGTGIIIGKNINITLSASVYHTITVYDKNWEQIKTIDTSYYQKCNYRILSDRIVLWYCAGTECIMSTITDDSNATFTISQSNLYNDSYLKNIYSVSDIYDGYIYCVTKAGDGWVGFAKILASDLSVVKNIDYGLFTEFGRPINGSDAKVLCANLTFYNGYFYLANYHKIYKSQTLEASSWSEVKQLETTQFFTIVKSGNDYYISSNGKIFKTSDFVTFTTIASFAVQSGDYIYFYNFSASSDNVILSLAESVIYVYGEDAKIVSTDKYVINGSTVTISYYTKDGFKICLADNTNDTNLATVYSYLGYYNYFRLDTANETISLPRNSNLYSMMYVGDNYQDTLDGISGNATRLLPQAEVISDSSASVSLDVKGNKDYQLSASALTALTFSSCEDSQLGTTIKFNSGATATTIIDSASIDWVDGATPIPSASVNCLIFIWNKIGFYKEW